MKSKELQWTIDQQRKMQQITIAVLSNITFEPYFQLLINKAFAGSNISVKVVPADYLEFLSGNNTEQIVSSDIVAVIPNFDGFYHDLCCKPALGADEAQEVINKEILSLKKICSIVRSKSQASIIWFGYEDYCINYDNTFGTIATLDWLIDTLNIQLFNEKGNDIVFVDLKRLIANVGISDAYDNKNKYRWNSPYSHAMIEHICNEIYKQYLIMNGITKKCIVLDCDNVLWGGILSEDGIENIHLGSSGLGRSYQDFQRYLLFLYNHGVILTVCSKNDPSDVLRMFREHSEMIVKEEHIACFQVNWNNKVDNIQKIAETLDIGLDSMVFIDDSDFEIQSVRQLLPEVTAIKYERDTICEKLSCFNLKSYVDIDKIGQRNRTYKTNEQRNKLKENSKSFDDYLNELDMKVDIHPALPIEFARIAELTQRTNKCTNGKRYIVAEIKKRMDSNTVKLYSVSVADRFSDLGLVGALEIEGDTFTLFSLSCRALGRTLESKMLEFIADKHQIKSIKFKSTGKNEDIKALLSQSFPNAVLSNC